MIELLTRFRDIRLVRYIAASVGALAVDMAGFLALLSVGIPAAPAAAAGYSLGILAHWLLSSRAVFADSVAARGIERTRQKALFATSALIGLGLTTSVVAVGVFVGLDPRAAKVVALVASFSLTWVLRSKVVFRPERAI